jgi:AbrB family looped-hinge helix DNA binding protein
MSFLLPYIREKRDLWMKNLVDSKLTSKFQATIPKKVRQFLRLDRGDLLVFVIGENEVLLKKGFVKVEDSGETD